MEDFIIDHLDHVAIRVKDIEVSASWYEKTLGLKRKIVPEWGAYPIFLLAGKAGVALFPATIEDPMVDPTSKNSKIDHFAFHVSAENFIKARKKYEALQLDYIFTDHHYFHSIYTKDPDGHTVELTTIVVDATAFYT
ncbi:VOC family protein [uncultured Dokdonia sp.]|uniref:VOC family protein n=1 Tax=uncultured Dokdonia sp. TaxID=575653 RepID=UPI002618BCA4|nr:VOC family protein [uncultured Dokdonia sp.]